MIVCYVRPWSSNYLKSIASEAFPSDDVETISEHKGFDTLNFSKEYKKNYSGKCSVKEYCLEEEEEVIERCRLLRDISKTRAKKMINATWETLNNLLNNKSIKIVISPTTDSYIIDLLRIFCEHREIIFIGLVVSFVDGYSRITSRGEYNFVKKVSQEEVMNKLKILRSDLKVPHYMVGKDLGFLKAILGAQTKEVLKLVYFFYKYTFVDPLNYHYEMSYRSSKKSISPLLFKLKFDKNWEEKLERNKTSIYLPLQYFPEATIDYWVSNTSFIDYFKVLNELIDNTKNQNVQWIVKEHPAIIGYRNFSFYKKLNNKKNVVMVPPRVNSKLLIELTNVTMVWTGTAGFEAAFRGKPVISCGKPFYANETMENFFFMNNLKDFDNILKRILRQKFEKNREDQNKLVSYLLNGLIKGQFQNPKRIRGSWINNFDQVKQIGHSIKEFFLLHHDKKK